MKVFGSRIRSAAQQNCAAIRACQKRQHRVPAHVGVDRHGIGAVAIKRFVRIGIGRVADVVAFGVENHEGVRRAFTNVANACGEFGLGAHRAEERNLRLVGCHDVEGRIDDAAVERVERLGSAGQVLRQSGPIWIQADTGQAVADNLRSM